MKGILTILCLTLLGVLYINQIEPIEVTKIVAVDKPFIVEKIVEKLVPVEVDRYTNTVIVVSPEATDEELLRAVGDIRQGRYAHQWYVDNASFQTAQTGDTALNIYWVDSYDLFRELLERAYGENR